LIAFEKFVYLSRREFKIKPIMKSLAFYTKCGLGLLLGGVISACQTPNRTAPTPAEKNDSTEVNKEAITAYIDQMEDTLEMAYNQQDADLFKRFYDEEAISYGEGREQLFGRSNMLRAFKRQVVQNPQYNSRYRYHTLDVTVGAAGKIAVESGKWVMTDTLGKEKDHGFYMVLFKKKGDRYLSIRDIWNTATAPAAD
jgi:ketosteroid isomerase-like protein